MLIPCCAGGAGGACCVLCCAVCWAVLAAGGLGWAGPGCTVVETAPDACLEHSNVYHGAGYSGDTNTAVTTMDTNFTES